MKILLLGGTADARRLASKLHNVGFDVVYSVAGLVRLPKLECPVRVGGFSQLGGLPTYLENNNIELILDVTHPYAQTMSSKAVLAAQACGIPCWRFHRPAWRPVREGDWLEYDSQETLLEHLGSCQKPLLSAGQMSLSLLNQILSLPNIHSVVWRTAVAPAFTLPERVTWLKAIGPFQYSDEAALFAHHDIDALVSKNSGGSATQAKLLVAQELALPIIIQRRPSLPNADREFDDLDLCFEACVALA